MATHTLGMQVRAAPTLCLSCLPHVLPSPPCLPSFPGFMLDQPLVLLYHCLLSHPFQIASWPEWGRALQALTKQEQ